MRSRRKTVFVIEPDLNLAENVRNLGVGRPPATVRKRIDRGGIV